MQKGHKFISTLSRHCSRITFSDCDTIKESDGGLLALCNF